MDHALIYGIADSITVLLLNEWYEGLLKHLGGADDTQTQGVLRVGQSTDLLNKLIVPTNLQNHTASSTQVYQLILYVHLVRWVRVFSSNYQYIFGHLYIINN